MILFQVNLEFVTLEEIIFIFGKIENRVKCFKNILIHIIF